MKRVIFVGLAVFTLFLLVKILFWGSGSFYSRYSSSKKLHELRRIEEKLNVGNAKLKVQYDEMKKGDLQLEKIAREEYGLQKEGETVVKFIEEGESDE